MYNIRNTVQQIDACLTLSNISYKCSMFDNNNNLPVIYGNSN